MYDIAFLIAAFNEEEYIEDCIFSCLQEKDFNIQVCVVSDGSTDKTPLILSRLARNYQNISLKILPENKGKVAAFNAAYSLAYAHCLSIIGADDLAAPFRVRESIHALKHADFVFGDLESFDSLNIISPSLMSSTFGITQSRLFSFSDLLYCPCVFGGTITMSAGVARKVFPVDPRLSHEDWWMPLVASRHGRVIYINKVFCRYRQHPGQTSKYKVSFPSLSKYKVWRTYVTRDIPYYESVLDEFQLDQFQKDFVLQKLLVLYCIRGCSYLLRFKSISSSVRLRMPFKKRVVDILSAFFPFGRFFLSHLIQSFKLL